MPTTSRQSIQTLAADLSEVLARGAAAEAANATLQANLTAAIKGLAEKSALVDEQAEQIDRQQTRLKAFVGLVQMFETEIAHLTKQLAWARAMEGHPKAGE